MSRAERRFLLFGVSVALALPAWFAVSSHLPVRDGAPLRDSDELLWTLAWSPDSRYIAVGGGQSGGRRSGPLLIWERATHKLKVRLPFRRPMVTEVSYSPDGRFLAASSYDSVSLWRTDSGSLVHALPVWTVGPCKWERGDALLVKGVLPTVKSIARSPIPLTLWRVETATGSTSSRPISTLALIDSVLTEDNSYSPDGKFCARYIIPKVQGSSSATQRRQLLQLWQAHPHVLLQEQLAGNIRRLWWQDGRHVRGIAEINASGRFLGANLWEFDCKTRRQTSKPLDVEGYDQSQISPDKRWLAWEEGDKVRLFDLKRGAFVATWETASKHRARSAFSPDSRTLAWLDGDALRLQSLERYAQ